LPAAWGRGRYVAAVQPQRGDGGQWSLYWSARGQEVPCRLVLLLGRWAGLDEREAGAGIGPRDPILIDPQYRIDPVLGRFFRRSRFAWLAEGSREAYARDYRLFFSFLWGRGRYWHEAAPDDLLDWEAWRRRDQPGRRISDSKWQREVAALRLLYEWAEKREHIGRSPVLVHEVRLRDGTTVQVADQAPRDVRSSDVKWLTPRTYRLWRDVGAARLRRGPAARSVWRGRNDARNAAFADLLFSSGLRLREAGCLLTVEMPEAVSGHCYLEGTVAGAVAKRRERMFYVSASALRRVAGYAASSPARCATGSPSAPTACSRSPAVTPAPASPARSPTTRRTPAISRSARTCSAI